MANPRIFVINFRDLVGFTNKGKNHEFYFEEETRKALEEMSANPENQILIVSEKDDEKLMENTIGVLFPVMPKNIRCAGKSFNIVDDMVIKMAEDRKGAKSTTDVFVIDHHPEIIPAARAKNLIPLLAPIPFGEKRPLSASYLFAAARISTYADAIKNPLNEALTQVTNRKSDDKLKIIEQHYQRIAELKNNADKALVEFKAAFSQYKQPKSSVNFDFCLQKMTALNELAALLNDRQLMETADQLSREFHLYEASRYEEAAQFHERSYGQQRQAKDYEIAKNLLEKASQLYGRFGAPQKHLELFALQLSLLRCHQNVLIQSSAGGSCIVEQLKVLKNFYDLYSKYKDIPNAISYKHLEAKLQPELNATKQIILNYFLAKLLPGASTGMPDDFDVNQMYLTLKNILEFERDALVSYKQATPQEATVLAYLNLDAEIRKAVSTAGSNGANTSFFVIFAQQLMSAISVLTPPSMKVLFAKPENLNRLFALLDAAYQECLKYQNRSLPISTALNGKDLTKIMHEIIQCKLQVLNQSRNITHLFVIGKENVLTKADGKTLNFPETTVPMLRSLLLNPNAVVVFTSDNAEFGEYLQFMRSTVDSALAANAIYLPKSFLASVTDPNADYMKSNIAQQTVEITEAVEANLFVMPNQQSIDAAFVNDVVKPGDYVLTKDQANWILAKKVANDLTPVVIEGNVATVLESLKLIHPAMLSDAQKGEIKTALVANAAKGKAKKTLHNFPVLLVSEYMRQQLGIRQPICFTIIHNNFHTVYGACQSGASAIWTGVVPGVASEQSSPKALALVPVLSILRSDSNTEKAYAAVVESFIAIDETNRHLPKHGAEGTLQQKSLAALDEKYGQCLEGKTLAANHLQQGLVALEEVRKLQSLPTQRAYDEAYDKFYNAAKKPLLEAINKAKLFNDKKTLFVALIAHADLSATWHAHAIKFTDASYRIKLNDFISDLLTSINQAELVQLINDCTDKVMLETFAKLLKACNAMLELAKSDSKQSFFRDANDVTAKSQIEREISLINLTLPKVEARLEALTPSLFSRLLSSAK